MYCQVHKVYARGPEQARHVEGLGGAAEARGETEVGKTETEAVLGLFSATRRSSAYSCCRLTHPAFLPVVQNCGTCSGKHGTRRSSVALPGARTAPKI
jgi:hypothetical protein